MLSALEGLIIQEGGKQHSQHQQGGRRRRTRRARGKRRRTRRRY